MKKVKQMSLKKFRQLTPQQQRVVLAKDALAYIAAGFLKPTTGNYIDLDNTPFADLEYEERQALKDKGAKENLATLQNCQVCEMGALLVAAVGIKNCLTISQLESDTVPDEAYAFEEDGDEKAKQSRERSLKLWGVLAEHFTPEQMLLIEVAFEEYGEIFQEPGSTRVGKFMGTSYKKVGSGNIEAAREFGSQFENDYDRAVAILENIIQNNGEFKP